ncbi:hypothetical protein ACJMK2_037605 [Sinanodonta woodiana]|uniref:Uncharacterized protein n=1 Tax=Sinanodonta woodiana TaxID=1069815 RepID=A0ABD3WPG2_SINWO
MSRSSLIFKGIAILSLLTVLDILFFGVLMHRKNDVPVCSADDVYHSVVDYIQKNGKSNLEDSLPDICRKPSIDVKIKENLDAAIKNIIQECEKERRTPKVFITYPIVALFSTWASTNDTVKAEIHKNTLRNWASLKPKIQPILFTNDSKEVALANEYGWHTLPIIHEGSGAPVLKTMFKTVIEKYSGSVLYGYANSDILFTDDLVSTLEAVVTYYNDSTPVLVTGRRTNVPNITQEVADSFDNLRAAARDRGELFSTNAEDLFFTNKYFPWSGIIDVVVGRLAYDNWLIAHTRCKLKIDIVDTTDSLLAVHQTTTAGGNWEGFKHPKSKHNYALLQKLKIKVKFENGFTSCAQMASLRNFCGRTVIMKRDSWPADCACV